MSAVACMLTGMQHDFDFIFGTWQFHTRQRRDSTDPECDAWVEFETSSHTEPILGGLSHLEQIHAGPGSPGEPWEGMTLRQFDPVDDLWRIWWASTRRPGHLDPPLSGRFTDGVGVFTGRDTLAGRTIDLRFTWTQPSPGRARWTQELSWDGATTWRLDWVMDFSRANADA
jgi:hypothetical protein